MSALPASVSSSSWIPEDDLLLKNAIESGASLEALAKGAVRFSRKFTVKELEDRWRALLYDPVISDQATARMIEVELSASNLFSNSKPNKFDNSVENRSAKRKSIRTFYYAMRRKRTCNHHVNNSSDVSYFESPNGNTNDGMQNRSGGYDELIVVEPREDCVRNQFEYSQLGNVGNRMQEDDVKVTLKNDCSSEKVENLKQNDVSRGSPSGVEGIKPYSVGCSSPQPDMPLWKTMEDVPAAVMPVNDGPGDIKGHDVEGEIVHPEDVDDKKICESEYDVVRPDMTLKDGYEISNSAVISGGDLVETDALLNFDGDVIDKSCYESVNLLLLNSPNDVHEDDTSRTKESETLVSDVCPGTSEAAYPENMDPIPDQQSNSGHAEQSHPGHSEINLPSSPLVSSPHSPELHGEVCCMLNSEDPEVPCNDDVLLVKALSTEECHKVGSDQASSFANQKDSKEELSLTQTEDNLTQCLTAPKIVGLNIPSESSQGVKSEFHDGQCHVLLRQSQNSQVDPYRFYPYPNSAADGAAMEEPSDECNTKDISTYVETSFTVDSVLEPEANNTSDQMEYESNDDVPSFSDIEAMINLDNYILDMDLCPEESDSFITREVSRYQDEHSKRTIIRLEQNARYATERAIASRGALAVLYGRHLKHYIKESEVILGRATKDVDVDIDLGREGRANKISRRQCTDEEGEIWTLSLHIPPSQRIYGHLVIKYGRSYHFKAIIKMEEDGSFSLKNLGKNSIFLNGKDVACGQVMGLSSSSLIEIRDMNFVFEINQKSVKRHLAKTSPKNQRKKTAFDWHE